MINAVTLSTLDYIVFGLSLFVSLSIGAYFAYKDSRYETSADNYFNGKGKMSPIPVGLSLAVSFVSALTALGYPVEVYLYGTVWFWLLLCFPLVVFTTCNYFIPIYYDLNMRCVYEYLELRFNKSVRIIGSLLSLFYMLMYLPVVVYLPSLALATVTPINTNWAIALTVVICSIYTIIGGFKSVIWTDAFQSFVMLGGCIALLVNLALKNDSTKIGEIIADGKRDNWDDFSVNPHTRCTVWSVFILGFTDWLSVMATSQPYVQRYTSCRSANKARTSLYFSLLPQATITLLSLLMGVFLYIHYAGCDPYTNGEIGDVDQLLPFAIVKNTANIPGLSGLFVATIYSGTFSTISSGINSIIVIVMEDFVSLKWTFRKEGEKLLYSKVLGVVVAVILLLMAYIITLVDSTVIQITATLTSAFASATFGMFILGIFIPWANPTGTIIGACCGFSASLWLSIGSLINASKSQQLSLSTDNCTTSVLNFTTITSTSSPVLIPESTKVFKEDEYSIYDISFMYYQMICIFIIIPVGIVASFVTGAEDPKNANPRLFMPLLRSNIFPDKLTNFMRFGVPHIQRTNKEGREEMVELNLI